MPSSPVDVILFDLGGVLIELGDISALLARPGKQGDVAETWAKWIESPGVRRFESGRISAQEFGRQIVDEFGLAANPDQFIAAFEYWPVGLYSGVIELLGKLAPMYRLGSLSNTNAMHWRRFDEEMDLVRHFDFNYPSHLTGRLKPDPETFITVAGLIGISPETILFIDDNQVNVDGARTAGLQAHQAHGVGGVTALLKGLGLYPLIGSE